MIDEKLVYSRIGMALIAAQRVEFITGELLRYLAKFEKEFYGVTPAPARILSRGHLTKIAKSSFSVL